MFIGGVDPRRTAGVVRGLGLLVTLALAGCGAESSAEKASLFSSAVSEVVLEVDYQAGAEPFTGEVPRFGETWDLLRHNTEALLAGSPKSLSIPNTLAEMEGLPAASGADFSIEQILDLAAAYRDQTDTAARRTFYALFLDGFFFDEGQRQEQVLGVSIGDSGVIAMFKPVMSGLSSARFVEQSTLVHELGHAVGLVENGLLATSAHHDQEHAGHCSNPDCVMYYLNEGAKDMVEFVRRLVVGKDSVLFDAACLEDTRAAAAGN